MFAYSREQYLSGPDATALHTVDVWLNKSRNSLIKDEKSPWIIYLHGGGWRDPAVDSMSFKPALDELMKTPMAILLGGAASINYRLSPHPFHPENPSSQGDPSRNVHYPSHVVDVALALIYLDKTYQLGGRYVLAGHSAGATMAFQLGNNNMPQDTLPRPLGILGISGIYNFEEFLLAHPSEQIYQDLMEGAYPDRHLWMVASPSMTPYAGNTLWEKAGVVSISHSDNDELVEGSQSGFMLARICSSQDFGGKVSFIKATGFHDEIWQNGRILSGLILKLFKDHKEGLLLRDIPQRIIDQLTHYVPNEEGERLVLESF